MYVKHQERLECKEEKVLALKDKITTNVIKYGGPCKTSIDVDNILNGLNSKTFQLSVLKDEINYLTKVIGIKDRRLVMTKKILDELKSDLVCVLLDQFGLSDGDTSTS